MKYQIIAKAHPGSDFPAYKETTILYEGESDEPFEELHKLKRRTFSDVYDKEFRSSPIRNYLKVLMNAGGEITIKIIR